MRTVRTIVVVSATLVLAGCTGGATEAEVDPPGPEDTGVRAASFDHAAAALPADDELPEGFSVDYRCPGGGYCLKSDEFEAVSVVASADRREDADEAEWWFGASFVFAVQYYPDAISALAAADDTRDGMADTTSGDFVIEPEESEIGGFRPGREGHGYADDYAVAGWVGAEGVWEEVLSTTDGERSAPRQRARIVVTSDQAVVTCDASRYADEGDYRALDDCRGAVTDYVERLGQTDPAGVPRQMTANRLAAAMPGDDDLPDGAEAGVRCPGGAACKDQSQDASVSYYLPLPDGVQAAGDSDRERFLVAGGEWSERIWLRAWIVADEQAARADLAGHRDSYQELVGELDTAAVATETGYDYGIRGRGEVIEINGEDWNSLLKAYDAHFIHLDGRVTERRYDIRGTAYRGNVLLRVDSSFTVEGRDQAEAVGFVQEQIAGFFSRLTQVE